MNCKISIQGFTKFNYTPLEVLAIIEHIQKRLKRTFTDKEIQDGILKDLITDEDYDIIKVVSTYQVSLYFSALRLKMLPEIHCASILKENLEPMSQNDLPCTYRGF